MKPERIAAVCTLGLCLAASAAAAEREWTLTNPTGRTYENEPVRLKLSAPAGASARGLVVKADGKETPCQIEEIGGRRWIWVAASLAKDQQVRYTVEKGSPAAVRPMVKVARDGDAWVLDNGLVAVKVPAAAAAGSLRPPVLSVRLPNGRWVGSGLWKTARKLEKLTAEVVGDGTVFGKVRLRYEFSGRAGLYGKVRAFAAFDVSVWGGQRHVVIAESHEMSRGDFWEFDCAAAWGARRADCVTHSRLRHAHGGESVAAPETLKVGQTRMGDTLLNLQPRWSQAFDEGWFFVCHDGRHAVGALVCRAARWHWPHNNLIAVKVKPAADYAGLRCPTWKGRRYWFLLAGPAETWAEKARKQYVTLHGFQPLDKLHHDYILDWPGLERVLAGAGGKAPKLGGFRGLDLFSSGMNPTSGLRGFGRRAVREAGKQGNLDTLTQAQVFLDPDTYGSYWHFWSPENANFFTDFNRCGIGLAAQLGKHPRFRELARAAEWKMREDMYHTITLPGGAGQECPGYVAYAMRTWSALAPMCRKHFGFDLTTWPRYRAGASFLVRLSQPIAPGRRRCHPGGDTHPPGPDVLALAAEFGVKVDVAKLTTEELPGFGVVFRNRPGGERETYLAFKSGPNRGHFHGDPLSFHYCADARQVAIDHMCSYGPRAGQEHMHNRVAFSTAKLPWANMDGYERLIAFKTSRDVDAAVGQVESERLRITTEYPPEDWDTSLPEARFERPLKYRRTIVALKNAGKDYFVVRDQHAGPAVKAAWCLHVLSDRCEREAGRFRFGNLTVVCAAPRTFGFARHDWKFEKKNRKSGQVFIREHTRGIRLEVEGDRGEFVTVLYPGDAPPKIEAVDGGVRVGGDEITFAGGIDDAEATRYVTVKRAGKTVMTLTGADIDMDRSQGEIGLFVPDAGYPFGVIPDWLIKQRAKVPDWAPGWARRARKYETP